MRSELPPLPRQITLIAIGELTNVAALIKADPLAAKKIKRIALMGGSIARGYESGIKARRGMEHQIQSRRRPGGLLLRDPHHHGAARCYGHAETRCRGAQPHLQPKHAGHQHAGRPLSSLEPGNAHALRPDGRGRWCSIPVSAKPKTSLSKLMTRDLRESLTASRQCDGGIIHRPRKVFRILLGPRGEKLGYRGQVTENPKVFSNGFLIPAEAARCPLDQSPVTRDLLHHLRFNPVVNPVRVPPFHGVDGNSIQQHGEMQVVAAGKACLAAAADLLLAFFT